MEGNPKKVLLSNKIKKIFSNISAPNLYLAGWETVAGIYCTSIAANTDSFLPGVDVIGFACVIEDGNLYENELLNVCEQKFSALQLKLENPIVLFLRKENIEDKKLDVVAKSYSPYYGTLTDLTTEDVDSNPAILLRARGQVPLILEVASDLDTLKENIELAIERLRTVFQSQVVAFLLQKTKYILHSLQDETEGSSLTCKNLLKLVSENESSEKSKSKKISKKKCPVNFDILLQASGDAALENTFNHSVVIHCQRREFQCASLSLPLDVIVVCHESSSTHDIYKLLQTAIDQQLVKISQNLLIYAKTLQVSTPIPYHFYPDIWEFPVTLIFPLNRTDKELETYRKDLHPQLLLPLDRPFLKKLNAHDFSSISPSGYLINPHEGLGSSGVSGGKLSIVQGKYSYHHYMQDHVNDNGWGCAYRSLQTIISWFKYQGYTDKNVPTHTEIQQALVDMGDKPQNFVGSKKWIGSQEVSFCLDHIIQIQSKIMFVSSGAELATKGRELFNHFRDQGTPIMIGGGVLAHTILGVDFNHDTGDLKFLILDPHYTGSEDINTILNKGWCGWKGIQFWDQTAFYNLCLAQRPLQI